MGIKYGYVGKIARVDLSKWKVVYEDIEEKIARNYIGGAGFGAYYLWKELKPKIDPLSPENKIIFSTGPFVGTPIPGTGNVFVQFKSPLTNGWGEARSGGYFGTKMKYAGIDAIIVEGRSEKPVYLLTENGEIEIKNAEQLWGKTVHETTDILREEYGYETSIACIGPAGENFVRFASIINDYDRAAGRGGGGAVMGSKKPESHRSGSGGHGN